MEIHNGNYEEILIRQHQVLKQLDALINLGDQWNWIKFRNEAALRIYCAELSNSHMYIQDHNAKIKDCIKRADELTKQLKGND